MDQQRRHSILEKVAGSPGATMSAAPAGAFRGGMNLTQLNQATHQPTLWERAANVARSGLNQANQSFPTGYGPKDALKAGLRGLQYVGDVVNQAGDWAENRMVGTFAPKELPRFQERRESMRQLHDLNPQAPAYPGDRARMVPMIGAPLAAAVPVATGALAGAAANGGLSGRGLLGAAGKVMRATLPAADDAAVGVLPRSTAVAGDAADAAKVRMPRMLRPTSVHPGVAAPATIPSVLPASGTPAPYVGLPNSGYERL